MIVAMLYAAVGVYCVLIVCCVRKLIHLLTKR